MTAAAALATRPTRLYTIKMGATVLPTQDNGYQMVEPSKEVTVYGSKVKYVHLHDTIFMQIHNNMGDILFSAPAHIVLYLNTQTAPGPMCPVVPVSILKGDI